MLWLLEGIEELHYESIMKLLPFVSIERRERILRLWDKSAQIQSVVAEFLLRYAIKTEYGIGKLPDVALKKGGKPYFQDKPEICFNLSHCRSAVACAVNVSAVGVDVQEVNCLRTDKQIMDIQKINIKDRINKQEEIKEVIFSLLWVLHTSEREWVLSGHTAGEREKRFIQIWTFKEAYGKAMGNGIMYKLDEYNFLPGINGLPQYGVLFQSFLRNDTVLTLCTNSALQLQIVSIQDLISLIPTIQ